MNKSQFAGRYECYALALLIVIVSVIDLAWIRQDTRPQPFSDGYPQKTIDFLNNLEEQGLRQFPHLFSSMSVGPRPPVYQLLTTPFLYLFHRSIDAMLVVNIIFQILLLLSTYGIATLARNNRAGLLAAFLVATYPPIVNLSKIARPHSVTPACLAISLYFLLLLYKTRSTRIAWLAGASLGFGFLIHPNLLYVMPAPSILLVLFAIFFRTEPKWPGNFKQAPRWFLDKLRDPFVIRGILPLVALAMALPAVWYLPRLSGIGSLMEMSEMMTKVSYGFESTPVSFWWYALTMPGAISSVLAALLAISLVYHIFRPQQYTALLTIVFILMYSGISTKKGAVAWMNFAMVLPVAAVLTATCLIDILDLAKTVLPVKRVSIPISKIVLLFCLAMAVLNFSIITWGMPRYIKPVAAGLGVPSDSTCSSRMNVAFCSNPPLAEDWRVMDDIVKTILDDPDCQRKGCSLAVVTEQKDVFRRSGLSFSYRQNFPESRMKIVPVRLYPEHLSLTWLTSDYLVYIPELGPSKYTWELTHELTGSEKLKAESLLYASAVKTFLDHHPLDVFNDAHKKTYLFTLPREWTAKLIKRTRPLTREEALFSVKMLSIPEDKKDQLLNEIKLSFEAISN